MSVIQACKLAWATKGGAADQWPLREGFCLSFCEGLKCDLELCICQVKCSTPDLYSQNTHLQVHFSLVTSSFHFCCWGQSSCIGQADLELYVNMRQNLFPSFCFCLLSLGIAFVHHQPQMCLLGVTGCQVLHADLKFRKLLRLALHVFPTKLHPPQSDILIANTECIMILLLISALEVIRTWKKSKR